MKASDIYVMQNRAIHAACGQVGLVYEENRTLWEDVMSRIAKRACRSLRQMSLGERHAFIAHLKSRGAKVKQPFVPSSLSAWQKNNPDMTVASGPGRPMSVPKEKKLLVNKINAQLVDLGLEWEYADGVAAQMGFSARFVEWCDKDQLYKIVQALAVHQRRRPAQTKEAL